MPPRRARGDIKQALRAALLSCVGKTDADDHHAPKTTSKPSAAGSRWKGGAKARNTVSRRPPKRDRLETEWSGFRSDMQ